MTIKTSKASDPYSASIFRLKPSMACLGVLLLSGCASVEEQWTRHDTLPIPPAVVWSGAEKNVTREQNIEPSKIQLSNTPTPPKPEIVSTVRSAPPAKLVNEVADINLNFDQISLSNFINVVYGTILKRNFSIDPSLVARKDLISFRTSKAQTPTQVLSTVQLLLKSYGVAVTDVGGFYRIVPDSNTSGFMPEIRRGFALPEAPVALRPIFQLIELKSVRTSDVANWVKQMFGNRVQLQEDPSRNGILLSGNSDDVAAALEAINVLDQPAMRGRVSKRISPIFWSADELSRKLTEVLMTEGYFVGTGAGSTAPINLIPVPAINALLVFSVDQKNLDHVIEWVKQLDQTPSNDNASGFFTYAVRHLDAEELAKTIQEVMGGGAAAAGKTSARVVVSRASNSLIIQGGADTYRQIMALMREIDRPAPSVLIAVTVAEVTLNDKQNLGIEWAFSGSNPDLKGGTLGGLGIGTTGLTINFLRGLDIRAVLNALATNNKAQILSSPRLMARNGEQATIQVGKEVPIVTSQQSNASTATATPGTPSSGVILQTIQYRSTGVILKVKPVIHAGGWVDLDVSQEVSDAAETKSGVNNTPTFSTRKVDTKLSLKDGSTVMLAGLMSQARSNADSGIPLLKDIPIAGQLFRSNIDSSERTELLVLITPYVINNDQDAQAITQTFRSQLGNWAQSDTLPTRSTAAASLVNKPTSPVVASPAASEVQSTEAAPAVAPPPVYLPPAAGKRITDPGLLKELGIKN